MTTERSEQIGQNKWEQLSQEIISSGYPKELWNQISEYAFEYLEQGRPNFDVNHTKAVVYWAFILGQTHNEQVQEQDKVDLNLLLSAALFHDIGYHGQFEDKAYLRQVTDKKQRHMLVGEKMTLDFFESLKINPFSEEKIDNIAFLVSIHDNLELVELAEDKGIHEARILLEADTIGAIDLEWVEPTYTGQGALEYLERPRTAQRHKLFKTPLAREILDQKIFDFSKHIIQRDFGQEV